MTFLNQLSHASEQALLTGLKRQIEELLAGNDDELNQVNDVSTFTQNSALRATLPPIPKKGGGILEVIRDDIRAKSLRCGKRAPVTSKHVPDLTLWDRDQRNAMNSVGQWCKEMETTAKHLGLKSCLATQGDEARLQRTPWAPKTFNDPGSIVRDVSKHPQNIEKNESGQDCAKAIINLFHKNPLLAVCSIREVTPVDFRQQWKPDT